MSLKEAIKAEARRLGFQWVGVTTPDPPAHLDVVERWLQAGRHAEMAYLATERARYLRADPLGILPECRSILVLGMHYAAPERFPAPESSGIYGRIAAYAWGEDYHLVFAKRLQSLITFVEDWTAKRIPHRWYTDTGPVLERELAQRAGLGWIGKNTCLIHPKAGSYFLLAEVFLGLDLPPDPPFTADHCGSCTRCIQACPTACILPDRTIDAGRCISYLTIELKGAIPTEMRSQMGNWVFGCDVCQQVCPWNVRFATPEGDAAFAPRPAVPSPDLIAEMALSAQDFSRKFRRSAVKRAKRRGYLRNVAIALGNLASYANRTLVEQALGALSQALCHDDEPLVRGHAAWALGRIGTPPARRALSAAIGEETDTGVLAEVRAALDSTVEIQ